LLDGGQAAPGTEGLEVGEVAVGAVVGAEIFQLGVAVDDVQDVAEQLIGSVVEGRWRDRGRAASYGAFEGSEEGELALGADADLCAEVGEIGMFIEDGEEFGEGLAALGFGEGAEFGTGHGDLQGNAEIRRMVVVGI
jgi:hypothetical protein